MAAPITTVPGKVTLDKISLVNWTTHLQGNLNWLIDQGGNLASATTLPDFTNRFHKVTGTTTIRNLASANAKAGQSVTLYFTSALTIEHNGGGTGNIRVGGTDIAVAANEVCEFVYDGSVWWLIARSAAAIAVTELADSTLGADAASFDFQNLPTGGHLEIFVYARTTEAANTSSIGLRANNDSGGNYYMERIRATGTSVSATESLAGTSFGIGDHPGANATAAKFGESHVVISHYANVVNHKAISSRYGGAENTNTGSILAQIRGGNWAATAAINRITLLPGALNILAGSRASIYKRSAP